MNTPKQRAFTSKLKELSKDLKAIESKYLSSNGAKFDLLKNREFLSEFNEIILKIGKCLAEQVKFSVNELANKDDELLTGGKKKSQSKQHLEEASKELIKTHKVFSNQIKRLKVKSFNCTEIKWNGLGASLSFSKKALLKLSEASVRSKFAVLNSSTVKREIQNIANNLSAIFSLFKFSYEQAIKNEGEKTKLRVAIEETVKEFTSRISNFILKHFSKKESELIKEFEWINENTISNWGYDLLSSWRASAESQLPQEISIEFKEKGLQAALDKCTEFLKKQENELKNVVLSNLMKWYLKDIRSNLINPICRGHNFKILESFENLALEKGMFSDASYAFGKKLKEIKEKFIKKYHPTPVGDDDFGRKVESALEEATSPEDFEKRLNKFEITLD